MLTPEEVAAKREELRALQQQNLQQARKLEEQQQMLARQQTDLVLRVQNTQGQIDALTMVLDGGPEKENHHAAQEGVQQEDHFPEHSH